MTMLAIIRSKIMFRENFSVSVIYAVSTCGLSQEKATCFFIVLGFGIVHLRCGHGCTYRSICFGQVDNRVDYCFMSDHWRRFYILWNCCLHRLVLYLTIFCSKN